MKYFIKESTFGRGLIEFGWGNGYVCIPRWHPLYKMEYNDIYDIVDLSCNGGLTMSEHASKLTNWEEIPKDCMNCWIIGFDTAHYKDTLERWPESKVLEEAASLAAQIKSKNIIKLWYKRIIWSFKKWIHKKTA